MGDPIPGNLRAHEALLDVPHARGRAFEWWALAIRDSARRLRSRRRRQHRHRSSPQNDVGGDFQTRQPPARVLALPGLLGPPDSDGTAFSVSFSPVEYGRRERGRLIIQTEETTWSYEVLGTNPTQRLPTDVKSMIDSKLDPEVERVLLTKNNRNAVAMNMRVGREKKRK